MWILTDAHKHKGAHFASRARVLICSLKLEIHNATYFVYALIHMWWLQQDLYPLTVFFHYSEPPQQGEKTVLTSPILPAHPGESLYENVTPNEILMNTLNHNEIIAAGAQIHEEPFYYLNKAHTEAFGKYCHSSDISGLSLTFFTEKTQGSVYVCVRVCLLCSPSPHTDCVSLWAAKMHHLKATGSHPILSHRAEVKGWAW